MDNTPPLARIILAILINAILCAGFFLLTGKNLHFRSTMVLIVIAAVNCLVYGPVNIMFVNVPR
ncbi:hypothetical protein [Chitinophaga pinensis]|uniref:Uncharacterized protein n=1 Tax=Chitinophaga pinensis TaxID=79329 RepID=A0A5C6LQH4_9BACT|nr:hypothetical protein [Chitinophaga pinensis]TWV98867.1 hypothetical protein FEF09_19215 [Chitinophaga pinensis]